jgi:pyrimidine oxygenase
MELGVFIPIANNGWIISTTSPQYMPSFELNRRTVELAEDYGFEFALSMIKLRGFGGPSQFWDYALESFTLMAGLAAVTNRIKLYASASLLTLHPAITARMATTIDDIAPGRFGINIVTGWQKAEFAQMGLWPGDAHYARRYDFAEEYVTVMKELWSNGVSNFQGEFFQLDDCRLEPRPVGGIELVCAGASARGMEFGATHCVANFVPSVGMNTPSAHTAMNDLVRTASEKSGRRMGTYVLVMVIADETDEAAWARWNHYQDGVDLEAMAWATGQASTDSNVTDPNATSNRLTSATTAAAANMGVGTLIGSYENIAAMLDETAAVPGTSGVMLMFDEFVTGMEAFGQRIQPLMASRSHVKLV